MKYGDVRAAVRKYLDLGWSNDEISRVVGRDQFRIATERYYYRRVNPAIPTDAECRMAFTAAERRSLAMTPRAGTPSLPTLSILNTDADIDPADLKAGLSAAREAGLS